MNDPRITLGPDIVGTASESILDALDRTRPIIRVDSNLSKNAATAAAALAIVLSRLYPHTEVEGDAIIGANPWGASTVADALRRTCSAVLRPTRQPDTNIVVGVGEGVLEAVLWVGGDDWTARLAHHPIPAGGANTALGVHAATALAAAEVSKIVLGALGMKHVPFDGDLVWNLLDYRLQSAATTGDLEFVPTDLMLLGCGSVGSSFAGVVACIDKLTGTIQTIDPDNFDPTHNPYRYPTATGDESGNKAEWIAQIMRDAGWQTHTHQGSVAEWVVAQPEPGFHGVAISSVDRVDGRLEVADLMAQTTLSTGVAGLALHVQREHPVDDYACPYCQFLDVSSPLNVAQARASMTGLTVERVICLDLERGCLTADDVATAVRAQRVLPEHEQGLIGQRLDDLIRRIYAAALVPIQEAKPAAVSAPYVSWFAGVILAAEVVKHAAGLPLLDRRFDIDLAGLPLGVTSRSLRDPTGRCVCWNPIRSRWARHLYETR